MAFATSEHYNRHTSPPVYTETDEYDPNLGVFIPVAGAFNVKLGFLSTAGPYFKALSNEVRSRLAVPVEKPVIPKYLGMCSMEYVYRMFSDDMQRIREKHGARTRQLIAAHSLGGVLALRYAIDHHDEQDMVLVTVSSPLARTCHSSLDPLRVKTGAIGRFAAETLEMIEDTPSFDSSSVSLIGSGTDGIVPRDCSLPEIGEASRFIVTAGEESSLTLNGETPIRLQKVSHHNQMSNLGLANFVTDTLITTMSVQDMQRQSSTR